MTQDPSDNPDDAIDDLESLIRFLEEENERIKQRVEEAARGWEFGGAKAYARTLSQITCFRCFLKKEQYRLIDK